MEYQISISIRDKIAKKTNDVVYVCGNSDFVIHFDFDEEWNQHQAKTARFITDDGQYVDQVFTGNQCEVPVLSNTYRIYVGVFASNLHTTTPAYVPAKKSILCGNGKPAAPPDDVYARIMELLNEALMRIEALEKGSVVQPTETSSVLGTAILGKMVLA